jgi:hypothetical protein
MRSFSRRKKKKWATESVKATTIRTGFWLSQDVLLPSSGLHQLTSTADADYWATVNPRVDPLRFCQSLERYESTSAKVHPTIPSFGLLCDCGVKQASATANKSHFSSSHLRIFYGYGRLTTPQIAQTA